MSAGEGSLLFYRAGDGLGAVGHINAGQFVNTQSITDFTTNWTHIVFIPD
jgi:hypothetical protein